MLASAGDILARDSLAARQTLRSFLKQECLKADQLNAAVLPKIMHILPERFNLHRQGKACLTSNPWPRLIGTALIGYHPIII